MISLSLVDTMTLLHQLFERQADRTPDATAIVQERETLTYGELERRSNQLANLLIQRGVKPGAFVGVSLERTPRLMVAILGVLKSGATYVPLDPDYPTDRLSWMIEETGCPMIVTDDLVSEWLPATGTPLISFDSDQADLDGASDRRPDLAIDPASLAYVMYTSGSTGRPKGVMIPHRGIVNRIEWEHETYPGGPGERYVMKASFSFDLSLWEMFSPLQMGGVVVLARPGGEQDPAYLVELTRTQRITRICFVPSAMRVYLEQERIRECTTVRHVFCGAEAMPTALRKRFFELLPGSTLTNMYGPLEYSIDATYWDCSPTETGDNVPIGHPLRNTTIYLVKEDGTLATGEEEGEIWIGGMGLADGYLKNPTLTAERFMLDPFNTSAGARVYKTGDLGRRRADGALEFLGRLDQQVKIRGYRVEVGEIESVLVSHPEIKEAVIVVREDRPGDKRLIGYIVPDTTNEELAQTSTTEHVGEWQSVFDDLFADIDEGAAQADGAIDGWDSSYTGEEMPLEDIHEWANHTVQRILSLKPRRVLDFGSGSGLLMLRVAPHCEAYRSTDVSANSVAHLRKQIATRAELSHVSVEQRAAHDFSGIEPDSVDLVQIGSVVQYFPSETYLKRFLSGAIEAVAPGGHVFLGDLRHLNLLEAFHASVQYWRAPQGARCIDVRRNFEQRCHAEKQLLVHPRFFLDLVEQFPKVSGVEIQLLRGAGRNEQTKFRYDVIVHVGPRAEAPTVTWHDWDGEKLSIERLGRILQASGERNIGIAGIPNVRIAEDIAIRDGLLAAGPEATIDALDERLHSAAIGIDPETLWRTAATLQCEVSVMWSADPSRFDAVFRPRGTRPTFAVAPGTLDRKPRRLVNNPLAAARGAKLVPTLRHYAQQRLPEFMVPSSFVALQEFPLNHNGKVDRPALPLPSQDRPQLRVAYVAPADDVEKKLAKLWTELLGVEKVGVSDNFFELGGHSLLAVELLLMIENAFKVGIKHRHLFEHPTVRALGTQIKQLGGTAAR